MNLASIDHHHIQSLETGRAGLSNVWKILAIALLSALPGFAAPLAADTALNFHLMHPGGTVNPCDPNAAFYLDGVYHLHYIISHPWQDKRSFSFAHVTSPDMLHWTWQKTTLQPSFTGHGMFSGTGFITKEGKPAIIYHGQGSGRNQIVIAKDNQLSAWEKPYPLDVKNADGTPAKIGYWDPDCFLIGDTYYAISGGNPPLMKSKDLKNWTYVGPFLRRELPDTAVGEDISCGNFFKLGEKWMLLCISHPFGCRYFIGDWDAKAEQFVPEKFGRMNWRREDSKKDEMVRDFFAPESVLTPDGRRVMWAWFGSMPMTIGKAIQSLPRELSLPADGTLRIQPARELESLRGEPQMKTNIVVKPSQTRYAEFVMGNNYQRLAELPGDAVEIRVVVARSQAERKRFGFVLFPDGKGGGLPVVLEPNNHALRLGTTTPPFAVTDLPAGEDLELRIFVDKFLVEIFANNRQSVTATHQDWQDKSGLDAWSFAVDTTLKSLEIWKLKPTNQGFLDAQTNRVWEVKTK